jgi:hypothetical protein
LVHPKSGKERVSRKNPSARGNPKKRKKYPWHPRGVYWRWDAGGLQLRRSRDDEYLGRMSGEEWAEMRCQFKGEALKRALRKWIEERRNDS